LDQLRGRPAYLQIADDIRSRILDGRLQPGERLVEDRLSKLIADNREQPTDELMWGTPGTALAASFMWKWTNEERWRDTFLKKVAELWSRWKYRAEQNCFLWRQRLYRPEPRIFLG